jgi:small GTP-binding protein
MRGQSHSEKKPHTHAAFTTTPSMQAHKASKKNFVRPTPTSALGRGSSGSNSSSSDSVSSEASSSSSSAAAAAAAVAAAAPPTAPSPKRSRRAITTNTIFRVMIVGEPEIGKTTLIQSFLVNSGGPYQKKTERTIDIESMVKQVSTIVDQKRSKLTLALSIIDTAGQERYTSVAQSMYRHVNVFVLAVDSKDISTVQRIIDYWIPEIRKRNNTAHFVVAMTKCDQFQDDEKVQKARDKDFERRVKALSKHNVKHASGTQIDYEQAPRELSRNEVWEALRVCLPNLAMNDVVPTSSYYGYNINALFFRVLVHMTTTIPEQQIAKHISAEAMHNFEHLYATEFKTTFSNFYSMQQMREKLVADGTDPPSITNGSPRVHLTADQAKLVLDTIEDPLLGEQSTKDIATADQQPQSARTAIDTSVHRHGDSVEMQTQFRNRKANDDDDLMEPIKLRSSTGSQTISSGGCAC